MKTWVDLKLPEDDGNVCLDEDRMIREIRINVNLNMQNGENIFVAMSSVMHSFKTGLRNAFCCFDYGNLLPEDNNRNSSCVVYNQICIEEMADSLIENGYASIANAIAELYDFIDNCQTDNWSRFREGIGIVPHCIWENQEYTYILSGLDKAFMAGYYDAIFEEARGLYHLPSMVMDIRSALIDYSFNLYRSPFCGISPLITDPNNLGCNYSIDDLTLYKQTLYFLRHNPGSFDSSEDYNNYINFYDSVKPYEISMPLTGSLYNCDNTYEAQEILYTAIVAIADTSSYKAALIAMTDLSKEIWELCDSLDNESRYFIAYYSFRTAIVTSTFGFTRGEFIARSPNYASALKAEMLVQRSAYVAETNSSVGKALSRTTIPSKSWFTGFSSSEKTLFNQDFWGNARALLFFNNKRSAAWKRLFSAPSGIRKNLDIIDDVSTWPASWQIKQGSVVGTIEVFDGAGIPLARIFPDRVVASGRSVIGLPGNKILNRVPPIRNMVYEVDGIEYLVDDLGRVFKTSGDLDDMVRVRLGYQQIRAVDVKDGVRGTDQGGHIIGARFFGAGEQINYYPQSANLNQGAWKTMENKWADEMVAGKDIKVEVNPIFNSNTGRPDAFEVNYWIDNVKSTEFFDNL